MKRRVKLTTRTAREAGERGMVFIDERENNHCALIWVLENLKDSIATRPIVIFMAHPLTINTHILFASLAQLASTALNFFHLSSFRLGICFIISMFVCMY